MFSETTVNNIMRLTRKILLTDEPGIFGNERDVLEAIEVLYQLMMIEDDEIDFGYQYAEAFETHFFEDSETSAGLCKQEGLMKKIIRIIDMPAWEQQLQTKGYWQLGDVYYYFRIKSRYPYSIKQEIKGEMGSFQLSACDPYRFRDLGKLCEHYCRAAVGRNLLAHDMADDPMELGKMRQSVLLVYLDMCALYKEPIKAKYASLQAAKIFDRDMYLDKVIKAYCDRESKYLTVYWRNISGVDISNKKTITTLVDTDTESKVIKLIGAAGVGKSESISYAQYQQCKRCVQASNNKQLLPIRIELIELSDSLTLNGAIARNLDVLEEDVENILTTYSVVLYLDGYNEILNTEVRRQTAMEIDKLIAQYPNMKVVIADRSVNTNPRCAVKATCYQLDPLDEAQIKGFFEKNTLKPGTKEQDKETLQYIMEHYQEKFKWLEDGQTTPFMLLAVIEMLQEGEDFPSEQTGFLFRYLECLLRREDATKLDVRIPVLKECLTDLVEEILPDEDAVAGIRTVRKSFLSSGAGDMDKSVQLVQLAMDMGILESKEEAEEIGWAKPEYFSYFFNRYARG